MTPSVALPVVLAGALLAASNPSLQAASAPAPDSAPKGAAHRSCANPVAQMTGADQPRPLFHRLDQEPKGVAIAAVERRIGRCSQPVVLSQPLPPEKPSQLLIGAPAAIGVVRTR